jgi:hypothetical protein
VIIFYSRKKNMKSEGYNKINIFVLQVVALSLLAVAKAGNLGLAYSSPVLAAAPIAHVAAAPIAHVAAAPIAHVAAPVAVKTAVPVATSYQNTYKVSSMKCNTYIFEFCSFY